MRSTHRAFLDTDGQAAIESLPMSMEIYGLALGESGHFFLTTVQRGEAQRVISDHAGSDESGAGSRAPENRGSV